MHGRPRQRVTSRSWTRYPMRPSLFREKPETDTSSARALACKAWAEVDKRKFTQARSHLMEALDLTRESGDRNQEAFLVGNLAVVAMYSKRFTEAEEHWRECQAISAELGDRVREMQVHINMAVVELMQGKDAEAREDLLVAIPSHQPIASRSLAYVLLTTSVWATRSGNHEAAAALLAASDTARDSLGLRTEEVDTWLRDEAIDTLRSSLGDAFDSAFAVGRQLGITEATTLAISTLGSS